MPLLDLDGKRAKEWILSSSVRCLRSNFCAQHKHVWMCCSSVKSEAFLSFGAEIETFDG
jgi:hypothetical protein